MLNSQFFKAFVDDHVGQLLVLRERVDGDWCLTLMFHRPHFGTVTDRQSWFGTEQGERERDQAFDECDEASAVAWCRRLLDR